MNQFEEKKSKETVKDPLKAISDVKNFIEWRLEIIQKQFERNGSKTVQEQLKKREKKLKRVYDFMNKLRAGKNLNFETTEQLETYLQKFTQGDISRNNFGDIRELQAVCDDAVDIISTSDYLEWKEETDRQKEEMRSVQESTIKGVLDISKNHDGTYRVIYPGLRNLETGDFIPGAEKNFPNWAAARDFFWERRHSIEKSEKQNSGMSKKEISKVEQPGGTLQRERKEREDRLLVEAMIQGSASVHTSWPSDPSRGGGGFAVVPEPKRDEAIRRVVDENEQRAFNVQSARVFRYDQHSQYGRGDFDRERKKNGNIREFVAIKPVEIGVYEKKKVQVQVSRGGIMGLFGKKEAEEKEIKEKTGSRTPRYAEFFPKGKNEPLFELIYSARHLGYEEEDQSLYFTDEYGRPGNLLDVSLLLPESLAREISSVIKTNPKFVRTMAREIILKKIHVAEEVYEKWKPPYSAWDKNGTSMYFWQEGDQPWEFTPDEKHVVKV